MLVDKTVQKIKKSCKIEFSGYSLCCWELFIGDYIIEVMSNGGTNEVASLSTRHKKSGHQRFFSSVKKIIDFINKGIDKINLI